MIAKSNFAVMANGCTEEEKFIAEQNGEVTLSDGTYLSYETFRFQILNSLAKYNSKFHKKYGKMILAVDDFKKAYWRKDFNEFYKGSRDKQLSTSNMPWKILNDWMKKLLVDISQNFPYTIIHIESAEADCIIGVLTINFSEDEDIMIVSRDHDFGQLHIYPNVYRYCPVTDNFLNLSKIEAEEYLFEHIVKGDKGDGIPNIKSHESIFLEVDEETGKQLKRQPQIRKNKIAEWTVNKDPSEFCETPEMLNRFERNTKMIDLSLVPDNLKIKIIERYEQGSRCKNNDKILPYIMSLNSSCYATENVEKMVKSRYNDFYINIEKKELSFEDILNNQG